MNILEQLKRVQESSSVPMEDQLNWLELSEYTISEGEVERLSTKGLLHVIDLLSYYIITECDIGAQTKMTEDEFMEYEESFLDTQGEIIITAALSSGVHPDVIEEMLDIRCDYYTGVFYTINTSL